MASVPFNGASRLPTCNLIAVPWVRGISPAPSRCGMGGGPTSVSRHGSMDGFQGPLPAPSCLPASRDQPGLLGSILGAAKLRAPRYLR